jgi:hypothetical protein
MAKKRLKRNAGPKRKQPLPGAELERVVFQLQGMMGPKATVKHDQKFKDRLGHLRQIDVLIEGKFGGWPTIGVIECKDNSRRKRLDAVEAFAKKTEHLGAGLRLMVSKKGFAKNALALAKHEHIHCLSLIPDESHAFGMEVGEWWYGVISSWVHFELTVFWADDNQRIEQFAAEEVLWQGKPVLNWFWREFVVTHRGRTKDGGGTLCMNFLQPRNLEIKGKSYPVKALSCTARAAFIKKRKWFTYFGHAFFDWHTGKITIPPGAKVNTSPITEDLPQWDDYAGEIPGLENSEDMLLSRGVLMLTQTVPPDFPIPDLGEFRPVPPLEEQLPPKPAPTGYDPHSPDLNQLIEDISKGALKLNPSTTEQENPPGVWSFTGGE